MDAIAVEISVGKRRLMIAGAYRSPTKNVSNVRDFIDEDLDDFIDAMSGANELFWLTDTDIDLSNGRCTLTDFLDKMAFSGLKKDRNGANES